MQKKKILVFGCGTKYQKMKSFFDDVDTVIDIMAFVDNNIDLQGKTIEERKIICVEEIKNYEYDGIYITSDKYFSEISEQLTENGIEASKIWSYKDLCRNGLRGQKKRYARIVNQIGNAQYRARILILTTEMDISGGINVVIYLSKVLQERGYLIEMAAPYIDADILHTLLNYGVTVYKHYCLPYMFDEDKEWIRSYDLIIVNVFQMMNSAFFSVKERPVIWWIHEDRFYSLYEKTQYEFPSLHENNDWMKSVYVVGVSSIAQESFNYFYPEMINNNIPFGIPDEYEKYRKKLKKNNDAERVILLIVGPYIERKGYDILASSIEKLSEEDKSNIELWIIGPHGYKIIELQNMFKDLQYVKYWGRLKHDDAMEVMSMADVVVCPSRVETMSMVIVEGLMLGKICITTDCTGIAKFINNKTNGFIVKSEDSEELAKVIKWVYRHNAKLQKIRKNARDTYQKYFTMEEFGHNMETMIENILGIKNRQSL